MNVLKTKRKKIQKWFLSKRIAINAQTGTKLLAPLETQQEAVFQARFERFERFFQKKTVKPLKPLKQLKSCWKTAETAETAHILSGF